jgi:hypothetical protein
MNARTIAFWIGLAAFALMAVLALTPLAWQLERRPSESYPELAFLGIGLPFGTISLTAGGLLAWNSASRPASNVSGLRLVSLLSLFGCGALLGLTFTPPDLVSPVAAGVALNALLIGAPVLGLVTAILATAPLINRRGRVS